jgi:hypothetical protein
VNLLDFDIDEFKNKNDDNKNVDDDDDPPIFKQIIKAS